MIPFLLLPLGLPPTADVLPPAVRFGATVAIALLIIAVVGLISAVLVTLKDRQTWRHIQDLDR